jgi:adenine-specific DNA methylase
MKKLPRLLIEDWLPAAAIGVECMRERGSASALAPHTYLHVWWARRPLTASRAAVLGSLLPADFPHDLFERLLGFGIPGSDLVRIRRLMDTGRRIKGGFGCDRAFKRGLREPDLASAHEAAFGLWGEHITVIDPMAGGGSIPLESARLGFTTLANEYNPVACSVLEATVDCPFRFGDILPAKARKWARVWVERITGRLARFYPKQKLALVHAYIFARTVPCPDTEGHPQTPLVPDWHLLKPKSGRRVAAVPIADKAKGTWTVQIRDTGTGRGQVRKAPPPTYDDGKGISLFANTQIPAEYIKGKAQAGEMGSALYAVALKGKGLEFRPAAPEDLKAIEAAERELARLRPQWEKANIIPTEKIPKGDKTGEPLTRGILAWSDMYSPRQLLAMGVLVEELLRLRPEIVANEGEELGEAVIHLLALVLDKFANYNSILASWHAPRSLIRSVFDRHDYSFKATFAEMAPCGSGVGLDWAIDNSLDAAEALARLPRHSDSKPSVISLGSATSLPHISDGSITAVVVDPPYAANVQYSELADFFYVWLKRTQGHRRPEWFSTYLCEHSEEAVVNLSRHKTFDRPPAGGGKRKGDSGAASARAEYLRLMTATFKECHRILRDDGVLTVMFTHKEQREWESLFSSLVCCEPDKRLGFTITATWPVKTESEHSLHQARKNAAQSTVILVARKRPVDAEVGYFDDEMKAEIRQKARQTAERLRDDGLNAIDQLVGSFGPAMEVYSRHREVRTHTGEPVDVGRAIDEASKAVAGWRVEQLAARGLEGVEPEAKFVLLCWDVVGAMEFRYNEAHLLGKAVGMDIEQLMTAGLVRKQGDKVFMLSARDRRREQRLEPDQMSETLFGPVVASRRRLKKDALKVHPNDPRFRTSLDGCHALALRYIEADGGGPGVGAAKGLKTQQGWDKDSAVARLMSALVQAAPQALRFEDGKNSPAAAFPEFRAWHELLKPLFQIEPPRWRKEEPPAGLFTENTEEATDEAESEAISSEE